MLQEKLAIFVMVLTDMYFSLFLLHQSREQWKLFLLEEEHGKVQDWGDFIYFMWQKLYRKLSIMC